MQNTLKFWISLNFQWGQLLPLPHLKSAPNYDYKKKKKKKKRKKKPCDFNHNKTSSPPQKSQVYATKIKTFCMTKNRWDSFLLYIYIYDHPNKEPSLIDDYRCGLIIRQGKWYEKDKRTKK